MDDYIIKRFENPDEVREFDKGKYEVQLIIKGGNGQMMSPLFLEQSFARQNTWEWLLVEMLQLHLKMKSQR